MFFPCARIQDGCHVKFKEEYNFFKCETLGRWEGLGTLSLNIWNSNFYYLQIFTHMQSCSHPFMYLSVCLSMYLCRYIDTQHTYPSGQLASWILNSQVVTRSYQTYSHFWFLLIACLVGVWPLAFVLVEALMTGSVQCPHSDVGGIHSATSRVGSCTHVWPTCSGPVLEPLVRAKAYSSWLSGQVRQQKRAFVSPNV